MVNVDDEVAAYVAQMLFVFIENPGVHAAAQQPALRRITRQYLQQCRVDTHYCNTAAIGEASAIAVDILASHGINAGTLRALREALARDTHTNTGPGNSRRAYDGILRQAIPEQFLRETQGTVIRN